MFSRSLSSFKILSNKINLSPLYQQRIFSSKPPVQPLQKIGNEESKSKPKKQPVPKITLITSDDNISVVTLEEAQHLSKRRDLKLVKVIDLDTKTQRPIYKLMTGAEYHAEDIKHRELKKKEKSNSNELKGEKLLMINSNIDEHDLGIYCKKILKWLSKKYEVRIVINANVSNIEKSEKVYKLIADSMKDNARIVQKRVKGGDLKFQVLPPKNDDNKQNNLNKKL